MTDKENDRGRYRDPLEHPFLHRLRLMDQMIDGAEVEMRKIRETDHTPVKASPKTIRLRSTLGEDPYLMFEAPEGTQRWKIIEISTQPDYVVLHFENEGWFELSLKKDVQQPNRQSAVDDQQFRTNLVQLIEKNPNGPKAPDYPVPHAAQPEKELSRFVPETRVTLIKKTKQGVAIEKFDPIQAVLKTPLVKGQDCIFEVNGHPYFRTIVELKESGDWATVTFESGSTYEFSVQPETSERSYVPLPPGFRVGETVTVRKKGAIVAQGPLEERVPVNGPLKVGSLGNYRIIETSPVASWRVLDANTVILKTANSEYTVTLGIPPNVIGKLLGGLRGLLGRKTDKNK